MTTQEARDEYVRALRLGQKEFKERSMAGKDPYPAVLDDILEGQAQGGVANIPLLEIPVEHIVGVKSQGRVSAFTAGFLPLLNPDSEFGLKWQHLCMAHLGTEGIRDPILCAGGQQAGQRAEIFRRRPNPRLRDPDFARPQRRAQNSGLL